MIINSNSPVQQSDDEYGGHADHCKLNMDQLNKNVEDEVVKLKLTKYKDYGLICD